jgi:hypothetical protein
MMLFFQIVKPTLSTDAMTLRQTTDYWYKSRKESSIIQGLILTNPKPSVALS